MLQYILSLVIIITVAFVYTCIIKPKKLYNAYLRELQKTEYKIYNLPFSTLGMPFYNIIQNDLKQGDAFKICKTVYTENDVILTNSFNTVVLDFCHPDFIKDFYSQEHLYTYPKVKFMSASIVRAMGRGIAFSEGQEWKRKRKIISAAFNFDFVKSITHKIEKLCDKAIRDVEETALHIQKNGEHIVEYDVINLTTRMFSSVVLQCFLGGATDAQLDGQPLCLFMNSLVADIIKQGFSPLSFIFGVKFLSLGLRAADRSINRRVKLFKDWGRKYIVTKIESAKKKLQSEGINHSRGPDDIIEALVRSRGSKQNQDEDYYSDSEILEEFSTFFVAGTDTTSHFVMTMIYYIAQHPEVQAKLRNEIKEHMSDNDYSYHNLKKMKYIDYIQKQTTRMYGPLSTIFLRQAKEDNYLNGLPVRKGTIVSLQHMGNHYSTKYFIQPFKFRPERWESECNEIPPFALGGFSAGERSCLGKHLVMIQSKIGLIKFMKRYKKITIPEGPLKMVIKFLYTPEYFNSQLVVDDSASPTALHQ